MFTPQTVGKSKSAWYMTKPQARNGDPRHPRVLIIHNPSAGGSRARAGATIVRLRRLGCDFEVRATARRGDAEAFARAAAGQGFDRVVAAGGDGTINEVVNGLSGTELPLALIPLGTANVLAAEIGLGTEPAALAETVVHGEPRSVCLGRVQRADGAARFFALMAGIGADAHAVAGISLDLKRLAGKGAYYAEILRQFLVFPFPYYRLTVKGTTYEAVSVVVANGRHYAGDYVLAPDARIGEPVLHVCLFEKAGRAAAMRYALAIQQGELTSLPDYRIVTGRKVHVEGPPGDPVQADGDIVASLPVEIEAVPDALKLVMPVAE
jgi:YegS/Rv2252/BmrU family lipid kinase